MTERDLPQEAVAAAERGVVENARIRGWRGNDIESYALRSDARAAVRAFHEHDACDCVSREAVIEALTDHYIHNTVCSDFKKAIEVIERTFPSKSAAVSPEGGTR